MSLILSGTDGLSDVDGSAATPAIRGTDANTGIFFPAADTVGVSTGGSERVRVDSSGNVGIGTSSPSALLQLAKASGAADIRLSVGGTLYANIYASASDTSIYSVAANPLIFGTNNTERMRIDSSGNVGIGTSSPTGRLHVRWDAGVSDGYTGKSIFSTTDQALFIKTYWQSGTGQHTTLEASNLANSALTDLRLNGGALQFLTGSTERMRIDSSGNLLVGTTTVYAKLAVNNAVAGTWSSACNLSPASGQLLGHLSQFSGYSPNNTTSYFYYATDTVGAKFAVLANGGIANYSANNSNLSDRREKTNFAPAGDYLAKICAIPIQTFNYIDQNLEEDDGLTLGVVAQDVQAVAPELVMESNWAKVDEEPKMRLSIYQTDLQYALMKSIQELKSIIDTQASTIQSLTDRLTALEKK